jgi:hypothetical protein
MVSVSGSHDRKNRCHFQTRLRAAHVQFFLPSATGCIGRLAVFTEGLGPQKQHSKTVLLLIEH